MIALLLACAVPYGVGPDVSSAPTSHEDDAFVFSSQRINRIELTISPDAMEMLAAERVLTADRNKVTADLVLDGEALGDVGVRLRGGLGSFQRVEDKPKWELDFNAIQDDFRFVGLESLTLNNLDEDCSGLREATAFAAFDAAGVPASRTGWAQLFVNGADYGLYLVVESQDDRWMKRALDDRDGNLYDGKYVFAGWWPVFLDLGEDKDTLYDLEEGTDLGFADIAAISAGVEAGLDRAEIGEGLARDVSWDLIRRLMLVERWVGSQDGYVQMSNNYKLWFPREGPMAVIPWDLDHAFDPAMRAADRWIEPRGNLALLCLMDEGCLADTRALAPEVANALDDAQLSAWAEEVASLTEVGWLGDPRGNCDPDQITADRAEVIAWPDGANARLRLAWAEGG